MNKKSFLIVLSLFWGVSMFAQFNPSEIRKSIVRVEVYDIPNKNPNVCTGFVWKEKAWVVTSLHAMNPKGKIRVLYLNNSYRDFKTKPIHVLKKADLVIIEIQPDEIDVPAGVVALDSYSTNQTSLGSDLIAMGYNSGALGSSTRTMKRGNVDPETLKWLIPSKDLALLGQIGFPAVDLPIFYMEGSLLPGFSGSPVFNKSGQLVGIGDGGLEKGASNVSWVIPAKYLDELENSSDQMPTNFDQIALLFSAGVSSESLPGIVKSNDPAEFDPEITFLTEPADGMYVDYYMPVMAGDFEFYPMKNRSIDEMAETSESPDELYTISDFVEAFNVRLDYDDLRFDIYEDIFHGVIIAAPEGKELYYDDETGILQVDYSMNNNVDLFYLGWAGDNTQTDFELFQQEVINYITPYIENLWGVSKFKVNQEFSYWMEMENDRKIANILLDSEYFEDPEFGGLSNVYLYITVLMSNDKSFISVASFVMSDEQLKNADQFGLNCLGQGDENTNCAYFNSLVKVFSAAHLSTFAW